MLVLRRNKSPGVEWVPRQCTAWHCPSEQGEAREGNHGSAAAKIRSTDRADEELLPGTNLVPVPDQELLASTDLFRGHATFAANGETRLSIHKHASRAWDHASHKRQSKELVHHLAYSEQE
jgi:hypothetical protein